MRRRLAVVSCLAYIVRRNNTLMKMERRMEFFSNTCMMMLFSLAAAPQTQIFPKNGREESTVGTGPIILHTGLRVN
jgi:hypothetical protein